MEEKKASTNKIKIVLIFIIAAQMIVIAYLLFDRSQRIEENEILNERVAEISVEKLKIEDDLQNLYNDYNNLKTSNDTLNMNLRGEQEKIQKLLSELKKVKSASAYEIAQYQKEVNTLRTIMRSYIHQIDSLNTMNLQLIAENTEVKKQNKQINTQKKKLESLTDSLSGKVAEASCVQAINVDVKALNKRNWKTNRVSKLNKFEVCFMLDKNVIAKRGERDVYLRIAGPDDKILSASDDKLFTFEDKQIGYSAKRMVNYTGEATEMCVYWDRDNSPLAEGKYVVDIFMDNNKIGTSEIELK